MSTTALPAGALIEATMHALKHPVHSERYQRRHARPARVWAAERRHALASRECPIRV